MLQEGGAKWVEHSHCSLRARAILLRNDDYWRQLTIHLRRFIQRLSGARESYFRRREPCRSEFHKPWLEGGKTICAEPVPLGSL